MISRLLQGAGNYKPKPLIQLPVKGDLQLGYYGRVPAAEFIEAASIPGKLGVGVVGSWNVYSSEWLKFAYKGKTLYMPRACVTRTFSYNQLQSQYLTAGLPIVVNGKTYKVRLITTEEWSDLIPHVTVTQSGGHGDWDNYTFVQISEGSGGVSDRVGTLTASTLDGKAIYRASVTNINNTQTAVKSIVSTLLGWRPVLEEV